MLSRLKDAALEKALSAFLRPKLQRYGELRNFHLDTRAQSFSAELMLHGETGLLTLSEARYRIERGGDQTTLVVFGWKVSREWVQNALEDFGREVRLPVPSLLSRLLE
jgi:hypothetical protein